MDGYRQGIRPGGHQRPQELHDALSLLRRQWLSGREMGMLGREIADGARASPRTEALRIDHGE